MFFCSKYQFIDYFFFLLHLCSIVLTCIEVCYEFFLQNVLKVNIKKRNKTVQVSKKKKRLRWYISTNNECLKKKYYVENQYNSVLDIIKLNASLFELRW